jgi:hypothetical protein
MLNMLETKYDLRTAQTARALRPTVLLIIRVLKMFTERTSLIDSYCSQTISSPQFRLYCLFAKHAALCGF